MNPLQRSGVWAAWLAPGGCRDFSYPERLLVGVLRLRLAGEAPWRTGVGQITRTFGVGEGERVVTALDRLFQSLDQGARRDFMVYPPACDRVSADERALLTALAAYQHGDDGWAEDVVRWMVRPSWQSQAADGCRVTAQAFADHRLRFHRRVRRTPTEGPGSERRLRRAG